MTPPSDSAGWCVDTSVAVPSLDPSHEHHEICRNTAAARRPAISGHSLFETFAVLTRLPGPAAASSEVVITLIDQAFPTICWLTPDQHEGLWVRMAELTLSGGMVDDALVAEASRIAGKTLLTRDRRALRTYEMVGVRFELIS